jgi:hypothetical protein
VPKTRLRSLLKTHLACLLYYVIIPDITLVTGGKGKELKMVFGFRQWIVPAIPRETRSGSSLLDA